jgi:hypothetical protein
LCLQPVRLTHSTVRWDARTSRHPLSNSFRSPHQLQHRTSKCFVPHTHTFPNPRQQHFRLFLSANCLPHKTGSRSFSLQSAFIERFIILLK